MLGLMVLWLVCSLFFTGEHILTLQGCAVLLMYTFSHDALWPFCYSFTLRKQIYSFFYGLSLILLRTNQCSCLSNGIALFPVFLPPRPSYPHLLYHFPAVHKPALIPSFSQVKILLCLEHISLISL